MNQYELWAGVPNGVTVYVPEHNLLAIKLENATLVAITEHGGRSGWMQTTGRLRGPFQEVYGKLAPLKDCVVPKPDPRKWNRLDDVPATVRVRDKEGDKWKHKSDGWHFKGKEYGNQWILYAFSVDYASKEFGPFAEIVK